MAAAGGVGAFQTSGFSTNPADYAALDTAGGISSYLAGTGTPLSTGGLGGVGAGGETPAITTLGGGGGQTTVTDQPGTNPGPGGGILDTIAGQFADAVSGWQAALYDIAIDLFWSLAVIEFFLSIILLIIGGGRPDFFDVVAVFIRWIMVIGLFSWLLLNASNFANAIIDSLRQAGGAIGSYAITPSAVFQAGINIATTVWNNYHGFWQTLEMIPVMIALIPIVLAFVAAAVWMLMILIESYFTIGLAVLFLAFGGLRWTRHIALSLLFACLGVGFRLLAIEALAPLATSLIIDMAQRSSGLSFQGIFTILGAGVAFGALAKIIPDRVERIVFNLQLSLAQPQQFNREAAGTAGVLVGTAALAGGSTALAIQAVKYAIEQMAQNGQQGQQPGSAGMGRGLQIARGAASAMARAGGAELSGRLGGLYRGSPAASVVRMASQVQQARRVAAAEASRPQPPGNTP